MMIFCCRFVGAAPAPPQPVYLGVEFGGIAKGETPACVELFFFPPIRSHVIMTLLLPLLWRACGIVNA
eukprot:scaffold15442_cov71-Skeletonema_menzelii.AAC.1